MSESTIGTREPQARILVVDDERIALKNLLHVLRGEGYAVEGAQSGAAAFKAIDQQELDLVLTDLRMEQVDGFAVLRHCRERHPDTPVILITGHATVASAVDAMREGAFHYIEKPFRLDEVRHLVREALELTRLRRENRTLREWLANQADPDRPLTQDPALSKLLDTARQIAPTGCNVIISGASGTGKELLARYLHRHSGRASGPFLAVNCGALSEELLVNELFGHERGAYTGATGARAGLVEAADGGTLFLDEVTEMSLGMQVKLLRVIQEGEVQRLGSTRPRRVDVRFIAATNRDLPEAVASGRFRQDLYYRLNVMGLRLPPLAERRSDVPLLAHYFLKKSAAAMGKPVVEITPEAMALLTAYDFPGNVRELANLIERGVALATGSRLGPEQLPEDLRELRVHSYRWQPGSLPTLEAQEGDYIRWVLGQTGGNRTRAAEILGIDRVSLWRKLKKYGIEV
jgi:DNA-binding NtrC family response regulator